MSGKNLGIQRNPLSKQTIASDSTKTIRSCNDMFANITFRNHRISAACYLMIEPPLQHYEISDWEPKFRNPRCPTGHLGCSIKHRGVPDWATHMPDWPIGHFGVPDRAPECNFGSGTWDVPSGSLKSYLQADLVLLK